MISFLHTVVESVLAHNFIESEGYTFRGSQLPYCATRDFLSICMQPDRLPKKLVPFFLLNAAETGTAMHKVIQKALAEKGQIFGNWECRKCKKTVERSLPLQCCGRVMEYNELHLEDPITGFGGHADAVIPYGDGYFLLDFKTKNPKKLRGIKLVDEYRFQVAAYKYFLIRAPHNLKILGSAVAYFSREDRPSFQILEIPPDELADLEFDRFRRQRIATVTAAETGDVSQVHKLCGKSGDSPYCPFQHRCFGPEQNSLPAYLKSEWDKYKLAQLIPPETSKATSESLR